MEIEDLQSLAVGTLRKTDSELPLKTNGWISTRNDAIFEAGDTFFKTIIFGDIFGIYIRFPGGG